MFEHRKMRGAALRSQDKNNPTPVEKELEKIVGAFAKLQDDRYKADYDVGCTWSRTDVKNTLAITDEAFRTWRSIRNEELAQHPVMSMFGARH